MGLKPRARPAPTWRWELSDPGYPIIAINATDEVGITAALAQWWAKIAELAAGSEMWDTMVGDIWLDSGRIIGHVQMRDVAVGYDTGFRVAAHVDHIADSLARNDYSDTTWSAMTTLLIGCAESAVGLEPARSTLTGLHKRHEFEMAITSHGQWLDAG